MCTCIVTMTFVCKLTCTRIKWANNAIATQSFVIALMLIYWDIICCFPNVHSPSLVHADGIGSMCEKGEEKKWLIQEYALITTLLFCGPLGGLPRTSVADARKQNSLDNNFRCGVTTHLEAIKLSTIRNWVYWKVFVLEALVGIVS